MTTRSLSLLFLLLLPVIGQAQKLISYIKPLTGTRNMGHTYPGATVPFGMVQLSPETDTLSYEHNGRYNPEVYRYCAGYQYDDATITGFSHTHFSGTGHSDLGDFLIMPTTGPLRLNPGEASKPRSGYRSSFSHRNETAEANYYRVKLDDYNILAELTTTARTGFHRYTFPASGDAHIVLDLSAGIYNYPGKNVWTYLRVVNDSLITGYRQTRGWARNRTLYFAMHFSRPFLRYGLHNTSPKEVYKGFWGKWDQQPTAPELAAPSLKAHFDFATLEGDQILIKAALSSVSMQGALNNLYAEAPHWDFDRVKNEGQQLWEQQLQRTTVETLTPAEKENFYTALYHTLLSPTLYMDADSQYMGLDRQVHRAQGFAHYTTFSLWDTYRALHPLFNILQPQRNADMIRSMLAHYDQSPEHMLPVWSNSANENWCMSGYHSVSVIADAIVKGTGGFDEHKALEACVATARRRDYEGIGDYTDLHYVPDERSRVSVSNTLEYAYDDWCIAQAARKLGRNDLYEAFIRRSTYYRNVYDSASGFMRPRLADGSFRRQFDPLTTVNQGFIEGNAWNYTLFVPHAPADLIALMGGNRRFVAYLDSLFSMELPDKYFAETEDITREGIIGNYVHGNEPSHHVAYLYNWTPQAWKTQERVRMILQRMYHPGPDGLSGNDDAGQMSAWYLFSALGFYPVAPGSPEYALGSPSVREARLQLPEGKSLHIIARNQSPKHVYVRSVTLNGRMLTRPFLTHEELMQGGTLVFEMSTRHAGR